MLAVIASSPIGGSCTTLVPLVMRTGPARKVLRLDDFHRQMPLKQGVIKIAYFLDRIRRPTFL